MLTSKYVHITTHFKELKGSECLCGASELSMNKTSAWNHKVGQPWPIP